MTDYGEYDEKRQSRIKKKLKRAKEESKYWRKDLLMEEYDLVAKNEQ